MRWSPSIVCDQKVNSYSKWGLLLGLYTTQTIGISFFVVSLVAILRSRGMAFDKLSTVYLLGMVWPFKFLWASWVDRIAFGRWGHYRGWMLLMQAGMLIVFGLMMCFDAVADFWVVYTLCFLMAMLSATQDIAVDATACQILDWKQRGFGNGIQIAGGLLGNLIGAGLVLVVYDWLGWVGSLAVMMMVTAMTFIQLLFYQEQWVPLPKPLTRWSIWSQLSALWQSTAGKSWLALLLMLPIGSSLAYALITPILVDKGWALERIGFFVNVLGSSVGVLSAFFTGWLIARVPRHRILVVSAGIQMIGIVAITLPVLGYTDELSVALSVVLYFACYNPAATILSTMMMDRVSHTSPGAQYTLQFSVKTFFSIGMISVGTALIGPLGYGGVLILSLAFGLLALMICFAYIEAIGSSTSSSKN
ncbi:MFS transporter [Vibrio coralliilyticus]|uniref:MFS transporter n=1 Tax=Vibrio coralliilyticus TaxID=190893 RepID=UPI00148C0D2F|nr:MFS transporter [Vibrio coralliilyticus]